MNEEVPPYENMDNKINSTLKKRKSSSEATAIIPHESESNTKEEKIIWNKQKIRKICRDSGKAYCTKDGKLVPEKRFENKDCHCTKKCINLISEQDRKRNFDRFWAFADFSKQNAFLHESSNRRAKKRSRPKNFNGTPRSCSFQYFLKKVRGDPVIVCKQFFLDTFNISHGRLSRVLKEEVVKEDLRGRMEGSSRKCDESLVNGVKDHINSFPVFEIDYSGQKYLDSEMNIKKMFKLYVEQCQLNNAPHVSEFVYRNIFKKEFNLDFFRPEKPLSGTNTRKPKVKKIKSSSSTTTVSEEPKIKEEKIIWNVQKVRKICRNSGNEYCTKKGKIIPEKRFENKDCHCTKGCINIIREEDRKRNFDRFWALADFSTQNLFLHQTIQRCDKKRSRPRNFNGTPRSCSYQYFLNVIDGDTVVVCKQFFLDTFNISHGRLNRALKAEIGQEDLRGRMEGSSRKSDENLVKGVKEHIESFPVFEVDYAGNGNSEKKYLSPDLNVRKMYKLYVGQCELNGARHVNESVYRNIFKKEFNLDFYCIEKEK